MRNLHFCRPKVFVALIAVCGYAAGLHASVSPKLSLVEAEPALRGELIPLNGFADAGTACFSDFRQQASAKNRIQPLEAESTGFTEWRELSGNWKYKSLYTGKTYDTSVRIREYIPEGSSEASSQQLELTNEIFDKALLNCDLANGRVNFISSNGEYSGLPQLKGTETHVSTLTIGVNRQPGNQFQYVNSGSIRLMTSYFTIEGDTNNSLFDSCYDYLYDASRPDAKISAEFQRVNFGKQSVNVRLTKGDGAEEVYYAVILEPRDESQITGVDNVKDWGWAYSQDNIATYIKEYAETGQANPHLLLGKVPAMDWTFDIPLQWTGTRPVAIASFRDGELADVVYDYIESRPADGWQSKGYVNVDLSVKWQKEASASPNIVQYLPENMSYSKRIAMEYHAATKEYRLVNPFGTGGDDDYLYINAEYGDDLAYLDMSYSPLSLPYEFQNKNGDKEEVEQPQMVLSTTAFQWLRGIDVEYVVKTYSERYAINVSTGSFSLNESVRPFSAIDLSIFYGGNYINGGAYLDALVSADDFVVAQYVDSKFVVELGLGAKIDHAEYYFTQNDTKSQAFSYRSGDSAVFIPDLLESNSIPAGYSVMTVNGFDADGNLLRTVSVDIPSIEYEKYTVCLVAIGNGLSDTGQRKASLCRLANSQVIVISDFIQYGDYYDESDNNFVIRLKGEDLVPEFDDFSMGAGRFSVKGYDQLLDGSIIGTANVGGVPYWDGNTINHDNYTVYIDFPGLGTSIIDQSPLAIEIPNDLFDALSGVEEVVVDADCGSDAAPVYYNLQGARVDSPAKGAIVIERRVSSARKIIF